MSSSELLAEPVSRIRISSPTPTRCAACLSSPVENSRFVDFQAAYDGGSVVEAGSMAIRDSIDELHLCEACIRSAAEAIGFQPERHRKLADAYKHLELRAEHWEAYAKRLEATLEVRPEAPPKGGRR